MNALALRQGVATMAAPGVRLFQLAGDGYEPTLRGGDYLMVADVDRFAYDSTYLLDFGDGEAPYLASTSAEGYSVRHPNPACPRFSLTREEFRAAVRAIVVAEVKMRDAGMLRRLAA